MKIKRIVLLVLSAFLILLSGVTLSFHALSQVHDETKNTNNGSNSDTALNSQCENLSYERLAEHERRSEIKYKYF